MAATEKIIDDIKSANVSISINTPSTINKYKLNLLVYLHLQIYSDDIKSASVSKSTTTSAMISNLLVNLNLQIDHR